MPIIPTCCEKETRLLDTNGRSSTFGCDTCHDGYLVHPSVTHPILLPAFLTRRGDGMDQRSLDDRDFADKLITVVRDDTWPSPAVSHDFGIRGKPQYAAVQKAVISGLVDNYDLDRVLGSGDAMTELISGVLPSQSVQFRTPYDDFYQYRHPSLDPAHQLIPDGVDLPPLYAREHDKDPQVLLKWFTPDSNWSWYVLEYDPQERLAFALVDGHFLEMGYVSVDELTSVRGPLGLRVERDLHFEPTRISEIRKQLEQDHEQNR